MKRRQFIAILGGAATAPLLGWHQAHAQSQAMPVVGFLGTASESQWTPYLAGLRRGLSELGYIEGRNVAFEYRWAHGRLDRLPALAADLVRQKVAVIAAGGGAAPALAAKAATSTIPIVFAHGSDPVKSGLVASLNRPGGNATGIIFLATAHAAKRLELLRELVPRATTIAILFNPDNPDSESMLSDIRQAAHKLELKLVFLRARYERDFEAAFASLVRQQAEALLIAGDRVFVSGESQLVGLAQRHAIPTIHDNPNYAAAGGLMTYGASIVDAYRQLGNYTARILKGEKPADLPVMQPTKFDLVLNLRTAKALGLEIPHKLLALADQVIE
jgi:putative ABC transport system substrate-binding protein